jgi:hypothetical protein
MSADICTRERRDARLEISQVCVIQQLKSASRAKFDPRQHFCWRIHHFAALRNAIRSREFRSRPLGENIPLSLARPLNARTEGNWLNQEVAGGRLMSLPIN